jgi:SprT protein
MEDIEYIEPITKQQQAEVVEATDRCIALAASYYGRDFASVRVDFDLRGKCAGMYQVKRKQRRIRYTPWAGVARYYA